MTRLRFASFEFDAAAGELWRDGRRVALQRQPSRLLELLASRPGELVTREEIRQALWGDDTHVDFERSLNFCVARLRSALRDNAASPTYVETVPSRGYRFIAPVDTAGAATSPEVVPSPLPMRPAPAHRVSRRALVPAAIAVAAVIALRLFVSIPAPAAPRVVVVPF